MRLTFGAVEGLGCGYSADRMINRDEQTSAFLECEGSKTAYPYNQDEVSGKGFDPQKSVDQYTVIKPLSEPTLAVQAQP